MLFCNIFSSTFASCCKKKVEQQTAKFAKDSEISLNQDGVDCGSCRSSNLVDAVPSARDSNHRFNANSPAACEGSRAVASFMSWHQPQCAGCRANYRRARFGKNVASGSGTLICGSAGGAGAAPGAGAGLTGAAASGAGTTTPGATTVSTAGP